MGRNFTVLRGYWITSACPWARAMKQRILAAAQRADGLSLDAVVEKLGM